MNILAITQSKDILGGANRSFIDVLDSLKKNYEHNIIVLVPGLGQFTEELSKLEIEYVCAKYNQVSFVRLNDGKDAARYVRSCVRDRENYIYSKSIVKKLNAYSIDLVYINDTTNTVGYYISRQLRVPFVWHFRGYHESIHQYLFNEKPLQNSVNGLFISISNAMKQFMVEERKLNPDNIVVIHNGVKNSGVTIGQPWSTTIKDEVHCVHCGHLSEAKGQKESIRAIAELRKRGIKNIYLHLAGTPLVSHGKSYKDELIDLIRELGVEQNVTFEGEVSDMSLLRKKMNIELMCSVAEPFGRVTVEGMQAGLVVIGCDTGATPEIISDGYNGLIYRKWDYKQLADKIELVISNRALGDKLSANALETTRKRFTMEENVKQINDVICEQVRVE